METASTLWCMYHEVCQPDSKLFREVIKTTTLEQDPPNHKIVGGVCLHPPCLTSKDGVFIA